MQELPRIETKCQITVQIRKPTAKIVTTSYSKVAG